MESISSAEYAYLDGRTVILTTDFAEYVRNTAGRGSIVVAHDVEDGWSIKTVFDEHASFHPMPSSHFYPLLMERRFFQTEFTGIDLTMPDLNYCSMTWDEAEELYRELVAIAKQVTP